MLIGIVGNEASDADSIVCAIVLAYLYNALYPENKYIPFMQKSFKKVHTRFDFLKICEISNFHEIDLFDTTHLALNDDADECMQVDEWILVDHNFPTMMQIKKIREIIDHHAIEGSHEGVLGPVFIEEVASCATLIAERVVHSGISFPTNMYQILYLTIIVDSNNLSKSKTTEKDLKSIHQLLALLPPGVADSTNEWYEQICDAKTDPNFWNNASIPDMLEQDFKKFHMGIYRVGIAVILRPAHTLDKLQIDAYIALNAYNVFVVIGKLENGNKDIYLWGEEVPRILPKLIKKFDFVNLQNGFYEIQKKITRKKFSPFLRDLLV